MTTYLYVSVCGSTARMKGLLAAYPLRPRPAFLESRVWVADVAMAVRDWCVDERHFGH